MYALFKDNDFVVVSWKRVGYVKSIIVRIRGICKTATPTSFNEFVKLLSGRSSKVLRFITLYGILSRWKLSSGLNCH